MISAIYEYNVLTETDDTHILMLDRRILCQLCKIYEQRARAGVFHLIFPEAFLLLLFRNTCSGQLQQMQNAMRRVVVTGLGAVTPLGVGES